MNNFSITQLAQFSGIRAHTIRIWEQRYNALSPQRTEGNTRFYDGSQLRRLLNIVSLADVGHKVSEISSLSDARLFEMIQELNNIRDNSMEEFFISQLIAAGMGFDEPAFEKTFAHCLIRNGIKDTYVKIVYPMLSRVGMLWSANIIPPAQEHFISNMVRQKLYTFIDAAPAPKHDAESWLLFLPEDEMHEMGLLLANYLLRHAGKKVIYLGAGVPLASLHAALEMTNPTNLLLFFVHRQLPEDTQAYINHVAHIFNGKEIFVACSPQAVSEIDMSSKAHFLHTVADLENTISITKTKENA